MIIRDFSVNDTRLMEKVENCFNEGNILVFYDLNGEKKAIKRLYQTKGIYFSNKLFTIHALKESEDKINSPQFTIPNFFVSFNQNIEGFAMPYIEGPTLEQILKVPNISIKEKIKYLIQIGSILRSAAEARKRGVNNFYLNDLHEKNFVLNPKTDTLNVVDLDSCSIFDNYAFGTKYLRMHSPLIKYPDKYKLIDTFTCGGEIIASEDTDLFCYAMIVLKFLTGVDVYRWDYEHFMTYLNYLSDIKANLELVDALSKVYSNDANVNIDYLLGYIPEVYDKSRELVKRGVV